MKNYISGVKKYAKDYTEEALRSEFRNVKHIILYAIDEDDLDNIYYDDYRISRSGTTVC